MKIESSQFASSFLSLVKILGLLFGLAACGNGDSRPPDVISLPTGFRPEGVAISGTSLFVGSIPTGRIFLADHS